ncbi:MAG: (d)CMP kinase [Nitrospirota bacterium]|jgi:cytidylate kinase
MGRVIAIDGPSGAGKSTVAKMLAEMMGMDYLDTGALYRAVALGLTSLGISSDDPERKISEHLENIDVSFRDGRVFLNGQDVSEEIRTTEAGHLSSVFSARKAVRDFLLPVQRRAAQDSDLVAEGRDMTTVVFPEAWRKFYLDASVEARAQRRYLQLRQNGVPATMEDAERDIVERDKRDSSRDLAPLRVADDAVYIDTSDMTLEEVMKAMLGSVRGEKLRV